ncbi:MAG TPA: hypothetical protein VFC18_08325 [Burkholderiales bacterium]|nr:hypothetical protein [Burkholderiales bacterium]
MAIATAALRAEGYRTSSNLPGHHAVTVDSLAFTMRVDKAVVAALNAWRRKRHRTAYEGVNISEHELAELITLVDKLRTSFAAWLRARHPEL